jgi:hypothetical protein
VAIYKIKWQLSLKVSKDKSCAIIWNLLSENKNLNLDSRYSMLSTILGRWDVEKIFRVLHFMASNPLCLMCKTICDLKDAFIFILLSCKLKEKPNGEQKLSMNRYISL